MNEQQIIALIQNELKKSQYKVGGVPLHTHNGIDSPKIVSGSSSSSATGRSHNPTLASIPINVSGVYENLQFQTNDFVSGITWDAANTRFTVLISGKYLVHLSVGFGEEGIGGGTFQYAGVKKNGTLTTVGTSIGPGSSSADVTTAHATDILNCNVGDYIEFFAMHQSNSTVAIENGTTETFAFIALQ